MDTITHGLAGALAGRAGAGGRDGLTPSRAMLAVAAASVFPDIDFIIAVFDPYAYLAWHRLLTHSLVLVPLWALTLAVLAGLADRRFGWTAYLPYMAAGLTLHIVLDAFNIWPLKPLWPLSELSVAWPVLFVIDPVYTGIVVVGLVIAWWWKSRVIAWAAIVLVALYTAVQFPLTSAAVQVAVERSDDARRDTVRAYGQPFSPFHRRILVIRDDGPQWAFLRQVGPKRFGYQPPDRLDWHRALHPTSAGALVEWAWSHPALDTYRDFATVPYVYAVENDGDRVCVWFADVRFTLPALDPAFRYGMCGIPGRDGWTRHRRGRW